MPKQETPSNNGLVVCQMALKGSTLASSALETVNNMYSSVESGGWTDEQLSELEDALSDLINAGAAIQAAYDQAEEDHFNCIIERGGF